MNKEERYKVEKAIELLKLQRDSTKFKYSKSVSNFFSILTLLLMFFIGFISIVSILISLFRVEKFLAPLIVFILIVFSFIAFKKWKNYKWQIAGHRDNLIKIDSKLETIYKNLINKNKKT